MENRINEFEIKNSKWIFYISMVLFVLELCAAVVLTVLYCVEMIGYSMFFALIIVVAVFFFPTVFMLYGYFKERFAFKNETFICVKLIKRTQAVKTDDLDRVEISISLCRGFVLSHIKMYNKEGKVALSFLDDGTAFKNGLFMSVLAQRNIPVKEIRK